MSLRFSRDGPEIPGELLDSLLGGEVVFLCGTGVSSPQLPDFPQLVQKTFEALRVAKTDSEQKAYDDNRFEEVLGSLSRRLADPRALARKVTELLAVPRFPQLDQHHTILRLSRDLDNRISVVTTNFDTLLERAAEEVLVDAPVAEISFAGQALPAPGSASFSGIVHIHGRLPDRDLDLESSPLVLTSADYGDAYMRSGWASRFLFDLARCKSIVLVGYSANDAPVRYFLNVLEADRARFPDLKPVYAFDSYEREPEQATLSWHTLAVTSLPYCKINPDTGNEDHVPLWRDLAALAEFVERPKHSRREHARAIVERPAADVSAEDRCELRWLFAGRRDLWSVALDAIADSEWFKVLEDEKLWSEDDAIWVIAAWVAKDFQNAERFECAREWQDRLGRPFTDKIGERLLQAKGMDEAWSCVWRLFCLVEPLERHDPVFVATQNRLASGVVLDSDLRTAVSLLAPKLVLSKSFRDPEEEKEDKSIQGIEDLARTRMAISDRHRAEELVDALQGMADRSGRILELATLELQSALALEAEIGLIGEASDLNDLAVPSIERHAQNQYREGVNFLVRVLAESLPQAVSLDRDRTRRAVVGWKSLPGRIGLRLCLHAMRNANLFDADEALSTLLAVSDVDFWSMRREPALLLNDRSACASPEVLSQVEERIRNTQDAYYGRFPIEEGEADWRAHARDTAVWLRLKMLQGAGVLSEVGASELNAIMERREYLDREVEDRDFFGSYSSGVRLVVGDAGPIEEAPTDDRLRVARELAGSPDLDLQQGWSVFCRTDPQGAFDALSKGELTVETATLWNQFLSGLAFGDEESRAIREELSVRALEHLRGTDLGRLQPMVVGLCDLMFFAPRQHVPNVEDWLVSLWDMVLQQSDEWIGLTGDIYEKAINSAAGKLTQTLLLEIDARKRQGVGATAAQIQLFEDICKCEDQPGLLGRAVLTNNVAFLLGLDRELFVETLGPRINAETTEGTALRNVMLKYGSITPEVTQMLQSAIKKGVVESEATDFHAATIASNVLRSALADLRGDESVEWGLSAEDVAEVLREAGPSIRSGILEILAEWLRNDKEGTQHAWNSIGRLFFERIWPKEREYLDASLTPYMVELLMCSGEQFPVALETLQSYISPYDGGYGDLHSVMESDMPERFPQQVLDLLWIVCGPKSRGRFFRVSDIIDRMVAADPNIEIDRRLQWLEQQAERLD